MATKTQQLQDRLNSGPSSGGLEFPSDLSSFDEYIQFTRKPSSGAAGSRSKIKLFIPGQTKDITAAEYETNSLDLYNNLRFAGKSFADAFASVESQRNSIGSELVKFASDVGKTAGSQLLPGPVSAAVDLTTRSVLNPALSYLFRNMTHRQFSFSFLMVPTSQQETNSIRDIIREFKSIATPSLGGRGVTGAGINRTGDRFLKYPDTVDIKYKNDEYLHKFGECVVKSVDVTYNASSGETWTQFSSTKAPTSVRLDLVFEELQIVTREDVESGF